MQKYRIILFFIVLFISSNLIGQKAINWITWDQMVEKQKIKKKKVIVDLYTDWCGWCKKMDKTTFKNPVIVDYLNKNFYSVKFNAEQKEDINFDGHIYKFVSSGRRGYHELAAALSQNKLSYPTYVFLSEDIKLLQVIPGYQEAKLFEYIINYFGGGYYVKTPWTMFEKEFQPKL